MTDKNRGSINAKEGADKRDANERSTTSMPTISIPKGGGAIHGIGETFAANPVTGTGSLSVPIFASPGRSGFGPQLSLSYDSGSGNGSFGFGWSLSLPSITRKTDKGLPRYRDADESDVFVLSGAEDLVPVFKRDFEGKWMHDQKGNLVFDEELRDGYMVRRYRPRIEGLFARIERWTREIDGDTHWRSISKDNILTVYGRNEESRIFDQAERSRIFSWLISESYDDKGNAILYEYKAEDDKGVALSQANESNRQRTANRYLKRILYGNRQPLLLDIINPSFRKLHTEQTDFGSADWMFELVFDYGEDHYRTLSTRAETEKHQLVQASALTDGIWSSRPDPFSTYRSGFEVRTYRRCQRVLMFHLFQELAGGKKGGNPQPPALPYLVRSTEFDYSDLDYSQLFEIEMELKHQGSTRFASFIRGVTQSGYVQDLSRPVLQQDNAEYLTYIKKSLPPLEFDYTKAIIQEDIKDIDAESLENLPYGLDGTNYQWVDLDGEGVSGILTEQADAWFYKANLGGGKFGPIVRLREKPSLAAISGSRQQLLDLAGDGQLDLVMMEAPVPGFYERTEDYGWDNFKSFSSIPNVPWRDPNLKFVDLTGDGHADIIISEDDAFTWYPSLAEEGFGPAERVRQAFDEEKRPRLVFEDATQSIYLADMSGDGLNDLVRIRNGGVSYWPNLGYGRFGAKVTMDNSPWFDSIEQFNQRHIRLADIDGSGTNDIIYLGRDGVRLYFNQSGNRWSGPRKLLQFPPVDSLSSVMTADLLGNGTACLVWSSPLPTVARSAMRYIDLMGGQKPHLLIGSINNLGAETRAQYASSTKFYLADKRAGKTWITRIPFPVHVVERVETYDRISRNRFVTRYAYHHGYFDGIEREFRGFGMVEKWDTEEFAALSSSSEFPSGDNIDAASHVPPVYNKTWFHTGVYIDGNRISNYFAGLIDEEDLGEYYREPAWRSNDAEARKRLLDDTVLQEGMTSNEEREACRALKGSMLRQEVYALDGTDKEQHPYIVTEQNFAIRLLQPRIENRHAVFFAHPREAISYHYERNPEDTRVTHALTLDVDDFGNVLRSLEVAYPMAAVPERQPEQNETHLTLALNRFANRDDGPDWRRIGVPVEARTYEVAKPPATALRFSWDELHDLVASMVPPGEDEPPLAKTIPYEQWNWRDDWNSQAEPGGAANTRLRLIEHVRTLYRPSDLGASAGNARALLPLGMVESLALPGESYKLAFTAELLREVYGERVTDAMLEKEGCYVHRQGDASWWIPSGRVFYSPGGQDNSAQELAYACRHFFLPHRYRDPFHTDDISTESFVIYDAYDLLLRETRDALDNRVTVGERKPGGDLDPARQGNDYRVLQPRLVMDPNRNRTAVAFDALGMVAGTAVMGKPEDKPQQGDLLDDAFRADLTQAEIDEFLTSPKGRAAASLLDKATTRIIYDLTAYTREPDLEKKPPAFAATIARETHFSDPIESKIQASFSYSDGFGREIQKKIQAEPGPAHVRDQATGLIILGADGQPEMTQDKISPRWVGSGWTVFNNKGKPVRQYEPFFTDTHRFEFDVHTGVSPVLFYDPVERVVATLHPNHTWEKVVFDPWHQRTYDVNDTVKMDPRTDGDIAGYVKEYFKQVAPAEWRTWLEERGVDPQSPPEDSRGLDPEKKAAVRTLIHADTPTVAHFDTRGRTFLTVAHNRFRYSNASPAEAPVQEFYPTRILIDIEGNQREVLDAKLDPVSKKGRIVMRYNYDMLGNRVHQASMEAGEPWMLNDISGKPIRAWDSREHEFHNDYDQLRRPTRSYLKEGAGQELLVGRTVYGEAVTDPEAKNLRAKAFCVFDQAGVVSSDEYDFKGNLLSSRRQLAREYRKSIDWSGVELLLATSPLESVAIEAALAPLLEGETFQSSTEYDALNRPLKQVMPDASIIWPSFNEANLLERIKVNLRGSEASTTFVSNIDYNSKGQRDLIEYGNGVTTAYEYDRLTFRLTHLKTLRESKPLQDLSYTYDPSGNIIFIRDDAQQTIYFDGAVIRPDGDYTYDAIYRLVEATGREHIGQASQPWTTWNDQFRTNLQHPNDGKAMRGYKERYEYDEVGNFLRFDHYASGGSWVRDYVYEETSLIEPVRKNNRLSKTAIGAGVENYTYDAHGSMTCMPHLPEMGWDFKDELQMADKGGGCKAYYVYDAAGQRVRKVIEENGRRQKERTYLGVFEFYCEFGVDGTAKLERETLHVVDDKQRIALVETRTKSNDPSPKQLIRYQFGNHLGSASLELDNQAQIISYEEFYPYGNTSYQAVSNRIETPKRYRYTSKERDEETGLYYHGARYYGSWLGRWTAADPSGIKSGVNLYGYANNSPASIFDPNGKEGFWHNAWEVTKGVGAGAADFGGAVVQMVAHPVDTLSAVGTKMKEEYHNDGGGVGGVVQAINVVNPAYHAMVAVIETSRSVEKGNYREAGRQGFNAAVQTVSTVLVATGAVGGVGGATGSGVSVGSKVVTIGVRTVGAGEGVMAPITVAVPVVTLSSSVATSAMITGGGTMMMVAAGPGGPSRSSSGKGSSTPPEKAEGKTPAGGTKAVGSSSKANWTAYGGKHVASPKLTWNKIVESTKSGPAKYRPEIDIEALERQVWAEGRPVTSGKPWKVMELQEEVGASGGKSSKWVRVEESAGTIHGHPITEAEFRRLTK